MNITVIDPAAVRDISVDFLEKNGQMRVVAAEKYAATTRQERALFGNRHGLYGFLTIELIDHLKNLIGERSAIEIGAGHGGLAKALGITATDSRMQEHPSVAALYHLTGQPTVKYGANVERLDALSAIKRHKPQVVIGCWVTHKYDPKRHEAGGNQDGIIEEAVIAGCETYIFIGNTQVHENKSIWKLPHTCITPPWLYSRAVNGSPDFIAVWERPKLTLQHSSNPQLLPKEA